MCLLFEFIFRNGKGNFYEFKFACSLAGFGSVYALQLRGRW